MKFFNIFLVFMVCFFVSCNPPQKKVEAKKDEQVLTPNQGIWITVFSKQKVLYSKEAIAQLMTFCKDNKINEIYLQIFRAGEAYYDSNLSMAHEYDEMAKSLGEDPIDYLLTQTHLHGIKIYAWMNVLSLAQNKDAPIIRQFGQLVLTRDKNQRSSIRTQDINDSDKFYLRDDQLFLEPGDDRVVDYTLGVVSDMIARYPSFDGLHLDYIRYPYPVPFIPDSRFLDTGVSYGFGERSIDRFKETYGLDALKDDIFPKDLYLKWDDWKRQQVTNLVSRISKLVKEQSKTWRISAAVVPGLERAYAVASQDWPLWLEKNYVDYVILMNYTRDPRLFTQIIKAGMIQQTRDRIYIGMGVFLFKNEGEFTLNYGLAKQLNPGGIVFFSYDEYIDALNKTKQASPTPKALKSS